MHQNVNIIISVLFVSKILPIYIYHQENWKCTSLQNLYINAYNSIRHDSHKIKTTQISMNIKSIDKRQSGPTTEHSSAMIKR